MSFIRKIKKGNQVYLAEVENKWVNGKCVQKHIRYVGKEADGKTILSASISNIEVEEVKVYGPLLVLNHLAQEISLAEELGEYGVEILSLVYAHCLDYQSLTQMNNWFKRTDLDLMLNLPNLTEKRLYNALDSLENTDSEILQKNIFEKTKERYSINSDGVLYDVTNTYLYGKKCSLAKLGHDKEGVKGRPLIQIGLGITKDKGIPMFHKVFDGNIHDTKTMEDLLSNMKRYHLKSSLFIFDRGISSGKNIRDIHNLKCKVLCGLPVKEGLKKIIRDVIQSGNFIMLSNRVSLKKTVFYVIKIKHEIEGVKGTLAICYNEQQRKDLRESRYDEIVNAQLLLRQGKVIKKGLAKYLTKKGNIRNHIVKEAEEFDGYSCIFSTKQLSKQDMVKMYFDKDLVEKAFRTIKGVTRLQPIRHWLYNRVQAHVFICYLAYLLLSLLKMKLEKLNMSPELALKELSTMYKIYMKDSKKKFKISRVVTLKKIQEKIIKAVNPKLLKHSV